MIKWIKGPKKLALTLQNKKTTQVSLPRLGPSSVAINNCGGWTLGTVRDVYMLYEKAGDHYLRRILAGLPVLSSHFAVSRSEEHTSEHSFPTRRSSDLNTGNSAKIRPT